MIVELAMLGGSGTLAVATVTGYVRFTLKNRSRLRALFFADLEERKTQQREVEKSRQCSHPHYYEIVTEKSGELVAFLCTAPKCKATLYLDEWKPAGCRCKPDEERFGLHCEVKYHREKAELLEAMKPRPVVKPKPPKPKAEVCDCTEYLTVAAETLVGLFQNGYIVAHSLNRGAAVVMDHYERQHAVGRHMGSSQPFAVWINHGVQALESRTALSAEFVGAALDRLASEPLERLPRAQVGMSRGGLVANYVEETVLVADEQIIKTFRTPSSVDFSSFKELMEADKKAKQFKEEKIRSAMMRRIDKSRKDY